MAQQHRNSVVEALGIALEALRWYADEEGTYDDDGAPVDGQGFLDMGERARAALAALEQDGEG